MKLTLGSYRTGPAFERLGAGGVENDLLQNLGPATLGLAQIPLHHLDDAFGEIQLLARIEHIHRPTDCW